MSYTKRVVKALLFKWQLLQNVLGLLVIFVTGAERVDMTGTLVWVTHRYSFGVSLGSFVIFGIKDNRLILPRHLVHEFGHCIQSVYLGPLYLLLIGLPSITFNIYDRLFHKKWSSKKRSKWYYSLPWEHWADKLGKKHFVVTFEE